jgi:hypothetical protein
MKNSFYKPLLAVLPLIVFLASGAAAQDTPQNKYPTALNTTTSLVDSKNNAATTLSTGINASDTSLTVASTSGFPTSGLLWIDAAGTAECVFYTSKDATHFLGLTRGQESTTAASHSSGVEVEQLVSAIVHNVVKNSVLEIEKKLGIGASNASSAATGTVLTKQADGSTTWTLPTSGGGLSGLTTNKLLLASGATTAISSAALSETGGVVTAAGNIVFSSGQFPVLSSTASTSLSSSATNNAIAVSTDFKDLWLKNSTGWFSLTSEIANVKAFGAKGDGRIRNTASTTATSTTITCSDCGFTTADVGKLVDVSGAGVAADLVGTIISFVDSTHVILNARASYAFSSQTVSLDAATIASGAMSLNSTTLTVGSAFFTADDVGKLVKVTNCGARNIVGTFTAFISSTQMTASVAATVSVSTRRIIYGTDDHAAIVAANAVGSEISFPPGNFINGSEIVINTAGKLWRGRGQNASVIYQIGPKMLDAASDFNSVRINQPANSIHFEDLTFSGTNWFAQTTDSGAAFGVYVDVTGPISNITATRVRFDSTWGIGFRLGGSAGATISAANAVTDIKLINCEASLNSFDGVNPNPRAGLQVINCYFHHNGTAGIESSTESGSYSNNRAEYNFQGGFSIGGLGGSEASTGTTFVGNTAQYNGNYGLALASNQASTTVVGNTLRANGYVGLLTDLGGYTLGKHSLIIGNVVSSNGTFGISLGHTDTTVIGNTVFDEGIPGYSQLIGILLNAGATNCVFGKNFTHGHANQDYNINENTKLDETDKAVVIQVNGGKTVTYSSPIISHLRTSGAAPTIAANGSAGSGATASLSGTDLAGTITLTAGSGGTSAGVIFTITFASTFPAGARIILSPQNANAAAAQVFDNGGSGTIQQISAGVALTAGQVYKWNYLLTSN